MIEKERLQDLCQKALFYKEQETAAAATRKDIEDDIARMLATKEEGTDKADAGIYRVTVTSKLNRDLDYEAYLAIERDLPEGLRCVNLKPSLDLKKLRALEMVDYAIVAHFISCRPAKPSVKIEVT